jgi:predicted metalloprotease with PDZ domain
VRAGRAGIDDLVIDAEFAGGGPIELRIDDETRQFVHDVEYAADRAQQPPWVRAPTRGPLWFVPCRPSACRVRYRFALHESATTLVDAEAAIASEDVVVAPPSSWLLRPTWQPGRFRFHVGTVPPTRFAAGTRPSPDGAGDTFEASTEALARSSFAVFGSFDEEEIRAGTARVVIAIASSGMTLSNAEVVAWVRSAVEAIAAYFGKFPADRTVVIVQSGGRGPTRGETIGDGGPAVLVGVGEGVTATGTRDDWVVTHELLHVSLPSIPFEHRWLEEGIATYVEPIVRARAGLLTVEKFWADLVDGLPQGLPEAGDEGLDRTHTWGRTYWGGALFCFVADVTIRERTHNARSLDDALRAIAATGATVSTHWTIDQFLESGDRATGTRVLHELYGRMALAPGSVDLAALWSRLGVRRLGDGVAFDDGAPLAVIRRAVTRRSN